jgi:DNA-binding SARP family transcriptional activator
MYEIKLFGSGEAYFDGKAIPGLPGQQHCILLCYLVLNRQATHTREQVATLFWGDSPSNVARKNLRNALWRLNQAFQSIGASLDKLISTKGEYLTFTNAGNFELDIDQDELSQKSRADNGWCLLNNILYTKEMIMQEVEI